MINFPTFNATHINNAVAGPTIDTVKPMRSTGNTYNQKGSVAGLVVFTDGVTDDFIVVWDTESGWATQMVADFDDPFVWFAVPNHRRICNSVAEVIENMLVPLEEDVYKFLMADDNWATN